MRKRRKKGNPLSRTVVITSMRPGFEKMVLGTTNICTVLAKKISAEYLSGKQRGIIKGALFLRGRVERGRKTGIPNSNRWHHGKATSHLLSLPPTWQFIHSHL